MAVRLCILTSTHLNIHMHIYEKIFYVKFKCTPSISEPFYYLHPHLFFLIFHTPTLALELQLQPTGKCLNVRQTETQITLRAVKHCHLDKVQETPTHLKSFGF